MNVDQAYRECAAITRREARNFSYGIALLPGPKRRALSAVCAMARRVYDIGDGDLPVAEKLRRLAVVRTQVERLLAGPPPDPGEPTDSTEPAADPVVVALADAARRFPIRLDALLELLDGCEADVRGMRYKTFEDLVGYCRQVGGSVGRLSLGVFDPLSYAEAEPLADTLGVAVQLTCLIRDLYDDRLRGRIYLPAADLDDYACTLELREPREPHESHERREGPDTGHGDGEPRSGAADEGLLDPDSFADLVRFEANRTRAWYVRGLTLLPLLDRRSRSCTAAIAGVHLRLLDRISADPDLVRTQRLESPTGARLAAAARALTRGDA
ncbi:phytoene/squalene synthase family protein [Actinopolymorpha rutila]|uniref:Phytoene synthase n=1 Tax=Actinopolymorpha rutila TaxID=446787 RepID=A0A852ZWK9_9ACTN|nr:squalene/phytoene synthase family protein [Actinopolymorpha rutila]NYH93096.1 phytoene synthase [Actinopolymorpha rutila]